MNGEALQQLPSPSYSHFSVAEIPQFDSSFRSSLATTAVMDMVPTCTTDHTTITTTTTTTTVADNSYISDNHRFDSLVLCNETFGETDCLSHASSSIMSEQTQPQEMQQDGYSVRSILERLLLSRIASIGAMPQQQQNDITNSLHNVNSSKTDDMVPQAIPLDSDTDDSSSSSYYEDVDLEDETTTSIPAAVITNDRSTRRTVHFAEVHIREYALICGACLKVRDTPLSLDWDYTETVVVHIDEFETTLRQTQRRQQKQSSISSSSSSLPRRRRAAAPLDVFSSSSNAHFDLVVPNRRAARSTMTTTTTMGVATASATTTTYPTKPCRLSRQERYHRIAEVSGIVAAGPAITTSSSSSSSRSRTAATHRGRGFVRRSSTYNRMYRAAETPKATQPKRMNEEEDDNDSNNKSNYYGDASGNLPLNYQQQQDEEEVVVVPDESVSIALEGAENALNDDNAFIYDAMVESSTTWHSFADDDDQHVVVVAAVPAGRTTWLQSSLSTMIPPPMEMLEISLDSSSSDDDEDNNNNDDHDADF